MKEGKRMALGALMAALLAAVTSGCSMARTNQCSTTAPASGETSLEATVAAFLAECAKSGVTNVVQMEGKLGLPELRKQYPHESEMPDRTKWHPVIREVCLRETPPDPYRLVKTKYVDNPSPYRQQAILLLKTLGYKCKETEAVDK